MDLIQAITLGLIQGIGEFLPISSSGHLVLLPKLFGWTDQGLAFDVALHFGTLAAILLFFWQDWKRILRDSYLLKETGRIFIDRKREFFKWSELKKDLLFIIIVATVPGVLAGLLLNDYVESTFRNPLLVGFALLGGSLILFSADRAGKRTRGEESIDLKTGLGAGLFQMLAIIPGMSRSGMTISAGLFSGLDRATAARFSFLLATPIILGATLKEYPALRESGIDINVIVGVLTAFGSGYLSIKYLLRFIQKQSYKVFVLYRLALALVIFTLLK